MGWRCERCSIRVNVSGVVELVSGPCMSCPTVVPYCAARWRLTDDLHFEKLEESVEALRAT